MSELGKKVPDDPDWLFRDNIVSRINQINVEQHQQALRSDGFKNSKSLQGSSKTPENREVLPETTTYYQKQSRKGQNSSNYQQSRQRKLYHQKKSRY